VVAGQAADILGPYLEQLLEERAGRSRSAA
jgi:hypothetical protein